MTDKKTLGCDYRNEQVNKQDGYSLELVVTIPSQIDLVIHGLFTNYWTGGLRTASIDKMRAQLYKNLKDQLAGYWTGHTAYWMLVNGGFIVDAPRGKKVLTAFGSIFKNEMETNDDALQTNSKNIHKSAPQELVFDKEKAIKDEYCRLAVIVVDCGYKCLGYPWDFARSARSIERRVHSAVRERDFMRANRLDVTRAALERLHERLLSARGQL